MTGTHEHTDHRPQPTPTGRTDRHPAWCDRSRCTADPASQANGYRPGIGGEHMSAPIPYGGFYNVGIDGLRFYWQYAIAGAWFVRDPYYSNRYVAVAGYASQVVTPFCP